MAMAKNGQAQSTVRAAETGLLANGSSGAWGVDVDEFTSGPERWFLQIEGPSAYFYFEIPSLDTIEQICRFLGPQPASDARPTGRESGSDSDLLIGTDTYTPVRLLRDDEFADRFFLLVGRADATIVRYTLLEDDAKCLAAALAQVREDLPAE